MDMCKASCEVEYNLAIVQQEAKATTVQSVSNKSVHVMIIILYH